MLWFYPYAYLGKHRKDKYGRAGNLLDKYLNEVVREMCGWDRQSGKK